MTVYGIIPSPVSGGGRATQKKRYEHVMKLLQSCHVALKGFQMDIPGVEAMRLGEALERINLLYYTVLEDQPPAVKSRMDGAVFISYLRPNDELPDPLEILGDKNA